MKRTISSWLLLLCPIVLVGAQQNPDIHFITDDFPVMSLIYHDYDPEPLDSDSFASFKENGVNRECRIKILEEDKGIGAKNHTLILWEDMAVNQGQYEFTGEVLRGFFTDLNSSQDDLFQIAAFNRRENTPAVLNFITADFTSDKDILYRSTLAYGPSGKFYPDFPKRSDIYSAIREGLDILAGFEGVRSIIVFTAGRAMRNSGSDSDAQVLLYAQRIHIPVYILQYYAPSGISTETEGFAESTYGTFSSYINADVAKEDLLKLYPSIARRYYGHTYQVAFTSKARHGEGVQNISFHVNGREYAGQFMPPPLSLGIWIRQHLLLSVLCAISLVAILVLSSCLIYRRIRLLRKERAEKDADYESAISDLKKRNIAENEKREREEERKRQEKEWLEKEREEKRKEEIMRIKNLYPRLHCTEPGKSFVYTMQKTCVSIGRSCDNDVVFEDERVSRNHAEILFDGNGFRISDKGSTNKTYINGEVKEEAILKQGDTIYLGSDAEIVFYL